VASCPSPGWDAWGYRPLSLRIVACLRNMAASVANPAQLLAF
jgi:hypothetical protein